MMTEREYQELRTILVNVELSIKNNDMAMTDRAASRLASFTIEAGNGRP